MELLFVSPGFTPHEDTPGAAQVSAALPKALKALGHRVTLVAPLPEAFDLSGAGFSRRLSGLDVTLEPDVVETVQLYDGRSMGGTQLLFLDHPLLANLFADSPDGLRAQLLFARTVAGLVEGESSLELAHVHDEAAALACRELVTQGRMPVVYTVYDLIAQEFTSKDAAELGLAVDAGATTFCPVAQAIAAAQFVTTVSPGRASHAVQQTHRPVGRALAARRAHFAGVLNGIDTSVYNPVSDPLLVARYSPHELWAKARNKAMLQRELGLDVDADVALLSAVESDVAAARLIEPLTQLLRNDVQVVLQVVDEDADCADALIALSKRYPERFQVRLGDSQRRTHAILSGSDILMLSGDDPASAMAAHRYGTLPVVAADTSAAEHCVDLEVKLTSGDAIVYDPREANALLSGMRRAAAAFNRGAPFDRLRARLMRIDHSFERTARAYDGIYETLLGRQAA